jgi:hypothetical protein
MRTFLTCLSLGLAVAVLNCSSDSSGNTPPPTGCADQGGGQSGQVTVGNILFRSDRNGTCNPAIDTVAARQSPGPGSTRGPHRTACALWERPTLPVATS